MKGLRFIRKRIRSIKNTQRITKAMKMVSAAKFSKAEGVLRNFRLFCDEFTEELKDLLMVIPHLEHIYLMPREERTVDLVIISSDRGLCGSYNANIISRGEKFLKELSEKGAKVYIHGVGKKVIEYFKKRGFPIIGEILGPVDKRIHEIENFFEGLKKRFVGGEVDSVYVVYSSFVSAISQIPVCRKIFPFDLRVGEYYRVIPLIEPGVKEYAEIVLEDYYSVVVRRILFECATSEHSARMTAMDNATKNAEELIDKLTLKYNKERQASITRELLDIMNGKEAIEFG